MTDPGAPFTKHHRAARERLDAARAARDAQRAAIGGLLDRTTAAAVSDQDQDEPGGGT